MIGALIGGRYRIDRKIGRGGFGEVYHGHDQSLNRDVAVKILLDAGYEDAFRKRFLRESEVTARLVHPNIVTVFDFGEYEGKPYLVLEFVNGPSLMDLADKAKLTMGQIIKYAVQICNAMAWAHDQGVVHRDLTLKNIMINEQDQVKILDFGLAKTISVEAQTTARMIGTPYYLAPEQIRNNHVDQRADIFAFGVGLFRLVNGRFPFEAEHPASVLYQIMNEANFVFDKGVPGGLKELILKCLEKDPNARYGSFGEVAGILAKMERLDLGTTVELRPAGVKYARSSKRNPYLNRVMIRNPDDFFGRAREVQRIYSRLDAPHPQSISVVGDRRLGKSSLLNYVYQRKNRKEAMQTYHDTIFIYIDLQRSTDLTTERFVDMVFGMLRYEQKSDLRAPTGEGALGNLRNMIEGLNGADKRIVILLDEFEAITKNQNFDMQFFSFLRFLANNFKVAYVTSSYLDLQRLCHNKDIADSPFFNIFSNLPLRPFSHDEAIELISLPSEQEGIPLAEYAPKILEWSGYFPLYIQIACSNLFEFFIENRGAKPNWKEIYQRFREEVNPHYSFVWEKMDEASKETLCRVAMGKHIGTKYGYISEDLERRGYLREAHDKPVLFSSSFGDFLLEQSQDTGGKRSFLWGLWGRRRQKCD